MSNGDTLYKERINLPRFALRMVIIDKDVNFDEFQSHLTAITTAHLRAALRVAGHSSAVLQSIRIEDLRLHMTLHRAFSGENRETGEPEAVVTCTFTGEVVMTNHGTSPGRPNEEHEINQVASAALKQNDILYGRLIADKSMPAIKKFNVHLESVDDQRTVISESSHGSTVSLGGTVLVLCILVSAVLTVRRRLARRRVLHSDTMPDQKSDTGNITTNRSHAVTTKHSRPLPDVL
jgi:hypothetical protein